MWVGEEVFGPHCKPSKEGQPRFYLDYLFSQPSCKKNIVKDPTFVHFFKVPTCSHIVPLSMLQRVLCHPPAHTIGDSWVSSLYAKMPIYEGDTWIIVNVLVKEKTHGTFLNWLEYFVEALLIMHTHITQRAIPQRRCQTLVSLLKALLKAGVLSPNIHWSKDGCLLPRWAVHHPLRRNVTKIYMQYNLALGIGLCAT